MTGTYRGRSRHRLPRREGARCAGRTGGAPQYVPVDVSPPATVFPQKRSKWHLPASHLTRNPCKSVPSGISLLSTCYEIPTKACQVAFPCCPPDTESPQKCGRWHLSAVHLLRNLRKSVPGGISRCPPATVFPQKCSRGETSFGGFVHYVMSRLFSRTNE